MNKASGSPKARDIVFLIVTLAFLATAAVMTTVSSQLIRSLTFTMFSAILILLVIYRERRNTNKMTQAILQLSESEQYHRMSDEERRIAIERSGAVFGIYDIAADEITISHKSAQKFNMPATLRGMPQILFDNGLICDESKPEYIRLFDDIRQGNPSGYATVRLLEPSGRVCHVEITFETVFNNKKEPQRSVIVFKDITSHRLREELLSKHGNGVESLPLDKFRVSEHNIITDEYVGASGTLIEHTFSNPQASLNDRLLEFARTHIHPDYADGFIHRISSENLLTSFYCGVRSFEYDFRMNDEQDAPPRFVRASAQLVEGINTPDIFLCLVYREINTSKRTEAELVTNSEHDDLTGVLTRAAIVKKVSRLIETRAQNDSYALIFIDIDEFRAVNTKHGYSAGDALLQNIAVQLHSVLGSDDYISRVGGDEFLICVRNASDDIVISRRAQQICGVIRNCYIADTKISGSIGISVCPRDGTSFDELYEKADLAMCSAKALGKDRYVFFSDTILAPKAPLQESAAAAQHPNYRILIVSDSEGLLNRYTDMLSADFTVIKARTANAALALLKRYLTNISVVLLDLSINEGSEFELLEQIRSDAGLRNIPIIAITPENNEQLGYMAVENGAIDYLIEPADKVLLRIRVKSAISRTDNQRLRLQNDYLMLQTVEEARYRFVLQSTGTIVIEHDRISGKFVYDRMVQNKLWGTYDHRSLWRILLADGVASAEDVRAMQEYTLQAAGNDAPQDGINAYLKTANGSLRCHKMRVIKLTNEADVAHKLIITLNDIHDSVMTYEALRRTAEYDELTGIFNRRSFIQHAQKLIESRAEGFYILTYIDINGFKTINDVFGYDEGDRLLKHIAAVLTKATQDGGLCCRISSDSFACICANAGFEEGQLPHINDAEMKRFSDRFDFTVAAGRYIISDLSLPIDTMLDKAAIAQQAVKGRSDRCVAHYDEAIAVAIVQEQEIVSIMDKALKDGEFTFYLQPQYNHSTGELMGAEALVRWNRAGVGMILPAKFIPIFERNGFVTQLDRYIWENVCILIRKWLDAGLTPVPVSVNVSRADVYNPTFANELVELMLKYDIPTSFYRLEITESAYTVNQEQVSRVISELRHAGFVVEMDDFGSGYSSLYMLKDIPVDILKLDMRFLSGDNSERGDDIIGHLISMAASLGIGVIAEGVETKQQADKLLSFGCEIMQGYYYSTPLPIAAFEDKYFGAQII